MRIEDGSLPPRGFGRHAFAAFDAAAAGELPVETPRVQVGALLELLPDAAAVVDADRRVVATNAAFRRTLRPRAALAVCNRVLLVRHAEADRRFAARVSAVAHAGREAVLRVPVPGAAEAIELRIAPVRARRERALVAVLVHDLVVARTVCAERLRELHGLTRAEADVAVRLASGCSLEGAAASLGVALNTVRTHVRHLFAKCGASTQAALLQRLALGAARVGGAVAGAAHESATVPHGDGPDAADGSDAAATVQVHWTADSSR